MNGTSTCRVKVDIGGTGVVSHVGLHALGSFADRLGLGDGLSSAIPQRPTLLHDRGKVLVEAALVLAGGGESCADIEHLRAEAALFGFVASDSTLHRSFHEIDAKTRAKIATKVASVRAQVWERSAVTKSGPVFLDIDASLVEIHSENKEETAPTYKGGFGFHPMICFADATGEALSGVLRPGNAGSNTAADHVRVLDEAISQLPGDVQAGHHVGDEASLVGREVVCRTDSGGTTAAFTAALRARNIRFFTSAMTNDQVQAPSSTQKGSRRCGGPRSPRTASNETVPRSVSSPRSSASRRCRSEHGSSSGESRFTPVPSAACSRPSSTATGAFTQTARASPLSSIS